MSTVYVTRGVQPQQDTTDRPVQLIIAKGFSLRPPSLCIILDFNKYQGSCIVEATLDKPLCGSVYCWPTAYLIEHFSGANSAINVAMPKVAGGSNPTAYQIAVEVARNLDPQGQSLQDVQHATKRTWDFLKGI